MEELLAESESPKQRVKLPSAEKSELIRQLKRHLRAWRGGKERFCRWAGISDKKLWRWLVLRTEPRGDEIIIIKIFLKYGFIKLVRR